MHKTPESAYNEFFFLLSFYVSNKKLKHICGVGTENKLIFSQPSIFLRLIWDPASEKGKDIVDHLRLTGSRHLSEVAGTDSILASRAHEQWLGGDETGWGIHLCPRQPPSLFDTRFSEDTLRPLYSICAVFFQHPTWISWRIIEDKMKAWD